MFEGEHRATAWGAALGRAIAWVKILGMGAVLRAMGKQREARILSNAFTAFSVYNSPRYDRSILSAVDNCLALRVRVCLLRAHAGAEEQGPRDARGCARVCTGAWQGKRARRWAGKHTPRQAPARPRPPPAHQPSAAPICRPLPLPDARVRFIASCGAPPPLCTGRAAP